MKNHDEVPTHIPCRFIFMLVIIILLLTVHDDVDKM